jgi:hypothetical protein
VRPYADNLITHSAAVKPAVPYAMLSRKDKPWGSFTAQPDGTLM